MTGGTRPAVRRSTVTLAQVAEEAGIAFGVGSASARCTAAGARVDLRGPRARAARRSSSRTSGIVQAARPRDGRSRRLVARSRRRRALPAPQRRAGADPARGGPRVPGRDRHHHAPGTRAAVPVDREGDGLRDLARGGARLLAAGVRASTSRAPAAPRGCKVEALRARGRSESSASSSPIGASRRPPRSSGSAASGSSRSRAAASVPASTSPRRSRSGRALAGVGAARFPRVSRGRHDGGGRVHRTTRRRGCGRRWC